MSVVGRLASLTHRGLGLKPATYFGAIPCYVGDGLGDVQQRFTSGKSGKSVFPEDMRPHLLEVFNQLSDATTTQETHVTLKHLLDVGHGVFVDSDKKTLLGYAQWLKKELPVRLAHRVKDLESLPHGLAKQPSIMAVKNMYFNSFVDIMECEVPDTVDKDEVFTEKLIGIKQRHDTVVLNMAMGVRELKKAFDKRDLISKHFESILDRFYSSRIGIRLLMQHHIDLHEPKEGWVGAIYDECSPAKIARMAADDVTHLCRSHFDVEPPEIKILGNTDVVFPFIPSHLYYIVFELFKNSTRAVIETNPNEDYDPILCVIADGKEDVTIKINDRGGGIQRSGINRMFSYTYTTAKEIDLDKLRDPNQVPPFAGFGYGLPTSRLYARYFGGDLKIVSMEGYGTDAYLHLPRLKQGSSVEERQS